MLTRFGDYAMKYQTIRMVDYLGDGLALEGMSVVDRTVTPDP